MWTTLSRQWREYTRRGNLSKLDSSLPSVINVGSRIVTSLSDMLAVLVEQVSKDVDLLLAFSRKR